MKQESESVLFTPCQGKDRCTEGGSHCQGCGRGHAEIARTRELISAVAAFAADMGYRNPETFVAYVADKARKKLARERAS